MQWRARPRAVPTTAAGVESAILLIFVGVRVLDLVQLGFAAPSSLRHATRPGLDAACLAVFVGYSVFLLAVVIRRGRYTDWRLAFVDVTIATVILGCQPLFTSATDRFTGWASWAYPIALSALSGAGLAVGRAAWLALAVAVPGVVFVGSAYVDTTSAGYRSTVVIDSFAFVAFTGAAFIIAGYLRRLGADADAARAAAAAAARASELDRHRLLLHDQETVLRLLGQPVLDPKMEELLRSQAAAGAVRIRTFLSGEPTGSTGDGTLGGCVRAAAAHFTDLPLTLSIDLAAGVQLEPATADAVEQAIRTLLHNVRNHAHANKVVIHADVCGSTGWELSVLDDGRGFDAAVTPVGFGLRQQVHVALMAHGISASITSQPGGGTMAVLRANPTDTI